jgi:hypothetical protein
VDHDMVDLADRAPPLAMGKGLGHCCRQRGKQVARQQVLLGNEGGRGGSALPCRDEAKCDGLGLVEDDDALATAEPKDERELDLARPEVSGRTEGDPEPLRSGGEQPDRLQGNPPLRMPL